MQFNSLVLSLLQAQFWSITPALPRGAPGTRGQVGTPDVIPDVTFITRQLIPADGFTPALRAEANGFIQGAVPFHTLYGLTPILISSFDDILRHFQGPPAPGPIGRIRIVSHGDDSFIFMPVFTNGHWDFGMQPDWLHALQTSDEAGLRFLISRNAAQSPLFTDVVAEIINGMRSVNHGVLAPFGQDAAGAPAPPANLLRYFQVVNDLYQVRHGSIAITTGPNNVLLTAPQQTTFNTSLGIIEESIRTGLWGAVIGGRPPLTDTHLIDFRDTVLGTTPVQLRFFGPPVNLGPTVIADVNAAMAAVPRVEADIRTAINGGGGQPIFNFDYLGSMVNGLEIFQPLALKLGGTDHDEARIRANGDLEAFCLVAIDLHLLRNGQISINNVPITAGQRTTLRNALLAISNMIRGRIGAPITPTQLNTLRDAIETRPQRQTPIMGSFVYPDARVVKELNAANTAMQSNFRVRYDHFRGLMQPGDASKVDVRGCLIGKTPTFLTTLRDFMGAANRPIVTAPEWFQSFPNGFARGGLNPTTFGEIDALVGAGRAALNITDADVAGAFTAWRGLIDFDAHFDFIRARFAPGASLRDFASLDWRAFQTATNPGGIPILKMEAVRIDDMAALNLGDVIERFRRIFEIPAATRPTAPERTNLTKLQPHVATFNRIKSAIAATAAPAAPTPAQLAQFLTDLTNLKNSITTVPGFPAPAPPLNPPVAPATQADIEAFATAIANHLDTILGPPLNPFFAAVQAATPDAANGPIHYYFNVGLPLLIQSGATPISFAIFLFASGPTQAAAGTVIANALRSWMRIVWTGTPAQAAAMNPFITALAINNDAQRLNAAAVAMLTEQNHSLFPTTDAAICPMPIFGAHIITNP